MTEPTLIQRTTAALQQTGLDVRATKPAIKKALPPTVDAWLRIGKNGEGVDYAVEAKHRLTPETLGATLAQLHHTAGITGRPTLLMTDYVSPPLAEKMRGQGQQFADAAGNAYLEGPGLLIYVTGHALQDKRQAPRTGHGDTSTGLKVLFALLCMPELADATHRAIAAAAGVALGAVPAVLADLQQRRHLFVMEKRRRLLANKRLLDEWAMAYARRLRHKTLQTIYVVKDFDAWKTWPLTPPQTLWGGEPAAQLLVDYLVPGVLTLYADKLPPRLLVEQRMAETASTQDANRVLELRKPFWGTLQANARPDTVPAILVYADLLAMGDSRCIETAHMVYDEYLARPFPAD